MCGENNNVPQLLTISEAKRYFGVSEYFLRKGIANGTIPSFRVGLKYYICVEKFQQLLHTSSFQ